MTDKEEERMYQLGISSGIERVSRVLMEDAAQRFTRNDDAVAEALRSHAVMFASLAKEAHPGPPPD